MLYYMTNKNAQIVFNGVSVTGNISMQDILMQMKWNTHTQKKKKHTQKKKQTQKTWQYICSCVSYTLNIVNWGKNKTETEFQQN